MENLSPLTPEVVNYGKQKYADGYVKGHRQAMLNNMRFREAKKAWKKKAFRQFLQYIESKKDQ